MRTPLLLLLLFPACTAEAPREQVCEPSPRTLEARRMAGNGASLDGVDGWENGVALNHIALNGATLNGIALNGWTQGVRLDGSELVGVSDIVGTSLEGVTRDGGIVRLRVASMERDGDVVRYALEANGENVCGGGTGVFVPGVWNERGAWSASTEAAGLKLEATFSCAAGVIAKCVTWGYAPWKVGAGMHQTCTRMARADYCGDGTPHTRDGTLIDIFDARGVLREEGGLPFEAGWGPDGAVCVSRPRFVTSNLAGAEVLPSCWAALPRCGSFEEAKGRGAIVGNASRPQSRVVCE